MFRVLILFFAMAVTVSSVHAESAKPGWGMAYGTPSPAGAFPAAGALLSSDADAAMRGAFQCSGTLIAPRAFLTAAHCVLDEPSRVLKQASNLHVFFQTAGIYEVKRIFVAAANDMAILELARPVVGVRPMPINTKGTPDVGTAGVIVGFGSVKSVWDFQAWNSYTNSKGAFVILKAGIKRQGNVSTSSCPPYLQGGFVCYGGPSALPQQAETCKGDSGGGLYSVDPTPAIIGVTSFSLPAGDAKCSSPQYHVDIDVFVHRAWIEEKLATIADGKSPESELCGNFACLGQNDVISEIDYLIYDTLKQNRNISFDRPFDLPGDAKKVIITMNGQTNDDENITGVANFNFYFPTCEITQIGQFSSCEIEGPIPGIAVGSYKGSGLFQFTESVLRGPRPSDLRASHRWRRPGFSSQTR